VESGVISKNQNLKVEPQTAAKAAGGCVEFFVFVTRIPGHSSKGCRLFAVSEEHNARQRRRV